MPEALTGHNRMNVSTRIVSKGCQNLIVKFAAVALRLRSRGSSMALHRATSGEVIRLPLGDQLLTTPSMALVKASELEVMRMVLDAGKAVPEHQVPGELTMQCLEGAIEILAHGKTTLLKSGEMMFLAGNVPHALHAVENSSLLVTIVLHSH
jgi:quercetin dioxygenase-like cupin family protein